MWNENRQIWARHIAEAHFSVIDAAKITAINKGLEALLNAKEPNRGNPMSFSDQIVFMSSMNEKKPNLDWTFEEVRGDLEKSLLAL